MAKNEHGETEQWTDVIELFCVLVNCKLGGGPMRCDMPMWADYKAPSRLTVTLRKLTEGEVAEFTPFRKPAWPLVACSVLLCSSDSSSRISADAMVSAREWLLRGFRLLKSDFLWMTYRPLDHVFDDILLSSVRIPPVVLRRSDMEHLSGLMRCVSRVSLGLHERSVLSHRWIRVMALGAEGRKKARSMQLDVALAAFERANDLGPLYIDCLGDFVAALEALFLAENDELSYRLATRAALLLGRSASEREQIQQEIRAFYRDRSYLAHGAAKALSARYRAEQLREHVRRTLLIHLALTNMSKDQVIERLDQSLFRPWAAKALRQSCVDLYGPRLSVALGI